MFTSTVGADVGDYGFFPVNDGNLRTSAALPKARVPVPAVLLVCLQKPLCLGLVDAKPLHQEVTGALVHGPPKGVPVRWAPLGNGVRVCVSVPPVPGALQQPGLDNLALTGGAVPGLADLAEPKTLHFDLTLVTLVPRTEFEGGVELKPLKPLNQSRGVVDSPF